MSNTLPNPAGLSAHDAEAWLRKQTSSALRGTIVSIVLVPLLFSVLTYVAVISMLGYVPPSELSSVVIIDSEGYPMTFWGSIAFGSVFFVLVMSAFGLWFVGRRVKIGRKIRTVLAQTHRVQARVVATETGSSKRGHMSYGTLRISAQTPMGHTVQTTLEEPIGTPLPAITAGSSVVVWAGSSECVVANADGLYLGAV
ncbi:MAG: hypothetical protein K0V04_03220 [Deltaproteobacteria bacterium]|nr:hypothetical protein [Deltaproteobacteria bacterium]